MTQKPETSKFPLVSQRGTDPTPIYNCPDHGAMWIEDGGGYQWYRCPAEGCGYSYNPERD